MARKKKAERPKKIRFTVRKAMPEDPYAAKPEEGQPPEDEKEKEA